MNFEDLKENSQKIVLQLFLFISEAIHVIWKKLFHGLKKRLTVIEDCAETCGGIYKGKKLVLGVIMVALALKKRKL